MGLLSGLVLESLAFCHALLLDLRNTTGNPAHFPPLSVFFYIKVINGSY